MTIAHRIPGIKHYRAIDQGFRELVKSDGITREALASAQLIASYANQYEAMKYPATKRSSYRVEGDTVQVGFKNRARSGARVVQEMNSWQPARDRVLGGAVRAVTIQ